MNEVQRLGKYMSVLLVARPDRKTLYWRVLDSRGRPLGFIEWYGAWRQYTFFPTGIGQPVFNDDCLRELAAFLATQNVKHRKGETT